METARENLPSFVRGKALADATNTSCGEQALSFETVPAEPGAPAPEPTPKRARPQQSSRQRPGPRTPQLPGKDTR
jgi:hypothetical protein